MKKSKLKDSHLSPRLLRIITLLAEGKKGEQIRRIMGINGPTYHVHCHQLRLKTGIRDHKCQATCAEYLATYKPYMIEATPTQVKVMTLLRDGKTYSQIQAMLGISHGTAMNHASQGRKRAGCRTQSELRQQQVIEVLDKKGTVEPSHDVDDY